MVATPTPTISGLCLTWRTPSRALCSKEGGVTSSPTGSRSEVRRAGIGTTRWGAIGWPNQNAPAEVVERTIVAAVRRRDRQASNGTSVYQELGGQQVNGFLVLIEHRAAHYDDALIWF